MCKKKCHCIAQYTKLFRALNYLLLESDDSCGSSRGKRIATTRLQLVDWSLRILFHNFIVLEVKLCLFPLLNYNPGSFTYCYITYISDFRSASAHRYIHACEEVSLILAHILIAIERNDTKHYVILFMKHKLKLSAEM